MNTSILNQSNQALTMSSREIAELTGKRHDNVTRDIKLMLDELNVDALKFEDIYLDSNNRKQTEYLLDKEHTECLLTGYSARLRMSVIKRWSELEQQQQPKAIPMLDLTYAIDKQKDVVEKARATLSVMETAQSHKVAYENCLKTLEGDTVPVELPPISNEDLEDEYILNYIRKSDKKRDMHQIKTNVKRQVKTPFKCYTKKCEEYDNIEMCINRLVHRGDLLKLKNCYIAG